MGPWKREIRYGTVRIYLDHHKGVTAQILDCTGGAYVTSRTACRDFARYRLACFYVGAWLGGKRL